MEEHWKKAILDHIPHGEEGRLTLHIEDAISVSHALIKNGYAVCITGGPMQGEYDIHWVYAGDTEDLTFADYDNVVFTSTDYIDDYPEAYYNEYREDNNSTTP